MSRVDVSITPNLREVAPDLKLGTIVAEVKFEKKSKPLWEEIDSFVDSFDMEMPKVAELPAIHEARKVYRALGKDPTRYRLSSDSLMRRIIKGQGLYQVNNIVDLNNLLSLKSGHSIGTYDIEKISGAIRYCVGTSDDDYTGIGRGTLNVEGLPILRDEVSGFGSATSDSERTMVTESTQCILMNIIAFDGDEKLEQWVEEASALLEKYANANILETAIVK